jgi:hypothetical protein
MSRLNQEHVHRNMELYLKRVCTILLTSSTFADFCAEGDDQSPSPDRIRHLRGACGAQRKRCRKSASGQIKSFKKENEKTLKFAFVISPHVSASTTTKKGENRSVSLRRSHGQHCGSGVCSCGSEQRNALKTPSYISTQNEMYLLGSNLIIDSIVLAVGLTRNLPGREIRRWHH